MKKKTLLRLVMVCLLLGCGVSGIKAQITIDKMANELEKRDDVAINSVTKRDPKTRKVIKVVKTYSVKDTNWVSALSMLLRRMKNMLKQP